MSEIVEQVERSRGMEEKIMALIENYADKHELAKECGAEYVWQSDKAQVDAIELVGRIFDLYANEYSEV